MSKEESFSNSSKLQIIIYIQQQRLTNNGTQIQIIVNKPFNKG